jgi:hypothetical protein
MNDQTQEQALEQELYDEIYEALYDAHCDAEGMMGPLARYFIRHLAKHGLKIVRQSESLERGIDNLLAESQDG